MAEQTVDQKDVLAFLADPSTHGGAEVKRIDTHAATVFLAGDTALKVKRAVRFPFLDYSTLAKRRQACEAELAVNAPYAPEIYLGVVPITRVSGDGLAIGGRGAPVEWAVQMRRFDETRTLDHVAGEIDTVLADALGRAVAAAHARAQPVDPAAWITALGSYIEEHAQAFRQYPDVFRADEIDALARASRTAYERIVPLLQDRGRRGLIRRIHGDLHLGNIVLIDGKPVIFDAIEFSEVIASGDVLYDLGFLLMDLLERDLPQAANVVFNRYLAQTRRMQDLDGLAALPLFLSMRAAIRARVTMARMDRAAAAQRTAIVTPARAYFALAARALVPPPAKFIAIGGLSGTGKTRLAYALAPQIGPMPGAVIVRSDVERKALFGIAETEKLPPSAYTQSENERVYGVLADTARHILAAGHSAIVDAVFARQSERDALAAVASPVQASPAQVHPAQAGPAQAGPAQVGPAQVHPAQAGPARVRLQGFFLTADLAIRLDRVGARTADASDAGRDIAQAQEHYDLGALDWRPIDASGTVEETAQRVRAALD